MKRLTQAAVSAAAIVLALTIPASADRLDDVKARGKLIVGVSDTTPPFTSKKDGVHVGYDIEIGRAHV